MYVLRRVLAGIAMAGGIAVPSAAMAQGAPNWTGFYLGAGVGASSISVGNTHRLVGAATPYLTSSSGGRGVLGTAMLGYDHRLGSSVVAGLFADYDFGKGSEADLTDLTTGGVARLMTYSLARSWSLGVRLGVLATPSSLVYLTGGTTGANARQLDLTAVDGASIDRHYPGHKLRGGFVGAGLETSLGQNVALRLEYRYADFGEKSLQRLTTSTGAFISTLGEFDVATQSVRAVLSYKFGREAPAPEPMK
jgi:outer membrane immunogenic protein